jgi:hypothetical protein
MRRCPDPFGANALSMCGGVVNHVPARRDDPCAAAQARVLPGRARSTFRQHAYAYACAYAYASAGLPLWPQP